MRGREAATRGSLSPGEPWEGQGCATAANLERFPCRLPDAHASSLTYSVAVPGQAADVGLSAWG